MDDKHMIWSNIQLDFEDWRKDLEADYPDENEDALYQRMHELNDEYLDDERLNLDIQLDNDILIIADLGLWHGRVPACALIESGNIKDCLQCEWELAEWYVDGQGELCGRAIHHDGTNYYRYREIRGEVSREAVDHLCYQIYCGKVTEADVESVTRPLGHHIAAVYGWELQPPIAKQPQPQAYER